MLIKTFSLVKKIFLISLRNPSDLKRLFGFLNWAADQIVDTKGDVRSIPSIDVLEISNRSIEWTGKTFPGIKASISVLECTALSLLVRSIGAENIFEFGTYKGVSTTQLALNLSKSGRIYTLDLPEGHEQHKYQITKVTEQEIAREKEKGTMIPSSLLDKIFFIREDSGTFDETKYKDKIDLVFVDGAHTFEYVRNDSLKGWNMLRKGGIIVWHDCVPSHPDVVTFVKGWPHNSKRINGTSLAYSIK